jgi:hypothetical protein
MKERGFPLLLRVMSKGWIPHVIHTAPKPSHGMGFFFIWVKMTTWTQAKFHHLSGVLQSAVIHPSHVVSSW